MEALEEQVVGEAERTWAGLKRVFGLIEAGTESVTSQLRYIRSPRHPEELFDFFKDEHTSATRFHGNLLAARADSPLLLNLILVVK